MKESWRIWVCRCPRILSGQYTCKSLAPWHIRISHGTYERVVAQMSVDVRGYQRVMSACERVVSHMWMCYVTYVRVMAQMSVDVCGYQQVMSACEWVASWHIRLSHDTYEWVMAHMSVDVRGYQRVMSACEWVMSHIRMRHGTYERVIAHVKKSRLTRKRPDTCEYQRVKSAELSHSRVTHVESYESRGSPGDVDTSKHILNVISTCNSGIHTCEAKVTSILVCNFREP